jgi:hypothetical protein
MRMKEAMRLAEWAWEAAMFRRGSGRGAGRGKGGVLGRQGCKGVGSEGWGGQGEKEVEKGQRSLEETGV